MTPLVVIVGRANVGKSTLFNRLLRNRKSIVGDMSGITRDRLYGEAVLEGKTVMIADTGGLDLEDTGLIISAIREQAIQAVNEADVIIFMVDIRAGLMPADKEIAAHLRRYGRRIILVLNKYESGSQEPYAAEFHELGLEDPLAISAEHGVGVSSLIERVLEFLPAGETEDSPEDPKVMRVAIIGKPNVGKSSLLNAIIGEGRMMVTEIAGTTRDVVDVGVEIEGMRFTFLDTAGIRKKTSITARVEAVGSIKARQSISTADCCILVVDSDMAITSQDKALAGIIDRNGNGAIIAMNKWDLVASDAEGGIAGDRILKQLRKDIFVLRYAPATTTCALSGMRVPKLVEKLFRIHRTQHRIIPSEELKAFLTGVERKHPPPPHKGKATEIFRISHFNSSPAGFRIFLRGVLKKNYLRYLEHQLRRSFDLEGVPMRFAIVRR